METEQEKSPETSTYMQSNKQPEHILWLLAGNQDFDSTVTLCSTFFAPQVFQIWPKIDQVLVTNTKLISEWPGRSYRVKLTKGATYRWKIERELFLAAMEEGFVHEADIIITTEMGLSLMAQTMDMDITVAREQGIRLRQRPVFHISPSVPEVGNQDLQPHGGGEEIFWYFVGALKNHWLGVLDNDFEMDLARKKMRRQVPRSPDNKIKRLVCDKFKGFKDTGTKQDVVVWQGRNNPGKRMDLAAETFALLSGQGIECEMYVPTGRWTRDALLDDMRKLCTVHESMSREEYLESIQKAKVALVTSDSESFATGCYEQVERGAIPVIRKRKWNRTWMTEDWPLVWTNTSEAAAMCHEAIKNYGSYRTLLEECMFKRWGQDLNFGTVMEDVWNDHIISADREFSVDKLKISSS